MEDITIVYHVLRKRALLINQIIKIIKREKRYLVRHLLQRKEKI